MVEQERAMSHLRVVRVYNKVILGPWHCSVLWTPVYGFTPPQTPGRSGFFDRVIRFQTLLLDFLKSFPASSARRPPVASQPRGHRLSTSYRSEQTTPTL